MEPIKDTTPEADEPASMPTPDEPERPRFSNSEFNKDTTIPEPVSDSSGGGAKKSPMRMIAIVVAVLLLLGSAAAAFMLSQNKPKEEPAQVKVGLMMAFTGGSSNMGYGTSKGIQLAKKELGADNIEIVQVDSKCDAKSVEVAINSLIEQDVVAIIGEGCSSASTKALPIANNAKIPMISPSASSPALSLPNDYFFRTVPPDTFQGSFLAEAIYAKGIKSVGVFYTNEPYGTGISNVFQEKFESLGGKVVATSTAEPDIINLDKEMKTLKDAKPEAIFFAVNSVVSGTAAAEVSRKIGITAPFFGADIFYDPTIIKNSPLATDGFTVSSFPTGSKAFKQSLVNEYKVAEQLYAAPQAYDALHAIYIATQKGAKTGEEIAKMLYTIEFDGVSAHIKFDQNGEISDPAYKYDLLQIKDGDFKSL